MKLSQMGKGNAYRLNKSSAKIISPSKNAEELYPKRTKKRGERFDKRDNTHVSEIV